MCRVPLLLRGWAYVTSPPKTQVVASRPATSNDVGGSGYIVNKSAAVRGNAGFRPSATICSSMAKPSPGVLMKPH